MRLGWRTANVVEANTHIPLSKDIPTYAAILNKNTSSVYGALVPKLLPSFSPPLYPPTEFLSKYRSTFPKVLSCDASFT